MNQKIPKIIHYCWFGGNPLPELAQKCIASWKKYCPEPMRSAILLYGFISVFCFLTRLPGEEIMAELFMKHISVRITVAL